MKERSLNRLPEELLHSLEQVKGFDRHPFINVHENNEQVTSIRINPLKFSAADIHFPISSKLPWTELGFYLEQRPSFTFDPLFHAGCYYVQEASSMFLEQAFRQLSEVENNLRVLDLCAAPGGKSTHIHSLLSPGSVLVANEVIKSRSLVLADNMIKWGTDNVIVTNNDPSAFAKLGGYFDVMVVDAPCSGSGLFRRDPSAIEEWSLNNVQLCCQRQKRILADALPALKQGGLLVYSTCSYSKEEDEDIADWLLEEMDMENLPLKIEKNWNIVTSTSAKGAESYRFYPDKIKGEGLFMSCFRKKSAPGISKLKPAKAEGLTSKERSVIQPWLKTGEMELIKDRNIFFALSPQALSVFTELKAILNITYKGVAIGQVMKEKLVPEHALALSLLVSDEVKSIELTYEESIKYLQRQEVRLNHSEKGWQTVAYKGHRLGWVNVLANRINNYYPKELRILKQSNDGFYEK